MNVRLSYLLAAVTTAALAAPTVTAAQGTFEGVITFQASAGSGRQQTMKYMVKGNKVRMDISAQGMNMFTLYDGKTKTMDMVIPMRQMYMERTVENAEAKADSAASKTKINWTGKKETIAGHECEDATITNEDGTTTNACLAKGLGEFIPAGGGRGGRGGAMGSGWEGHIGQTFPLKVEHNGEVQLLVTSIEKKPLADSLFAIPTGYTKMSMPFGGRGGR